MTRCNCFRPPPPPLLTKDADYFPRQAIGVTCQRGDTSGENLSVYRCLLNKEKILQSDIRDVRQEV